MLSYLLFNLSSMILIMAGTLLIMLLIFKSQTMSLLLTLESFVLMNLCLVIKELADANLSASFLMVFLVVVVSEAMIGISLMISYSRTKGYSYFMI